MKKKAQNLNAMEEEEEEDDLTAPLSSSQSDICQVLMERYSKSSASQHRHLCASAAAMKSILEEENLPLTPLTFFAATISAISDTADDSNSTSALYSFLSILLPLIPSESLSSNKASEAVDVLVGLLKRQEGNVSTATVRCVVKSLGSLMLLCDLKDWSKVTTPFQTILRFSIDKRPKVRKSAQLCLAKVFKSFPSLVVKEASQVVLALFKNYMPRASKLSSAKSVDGSKHELLSKPEHMEVVHMLNSLKLIVPCLSEEVGQKMLSDLYKLLTCQFSPFTRHLFDILEVFVEYSRTDVIFPQAENIIVSLASYVSAGEKNPMDTVMSASVLLKSIMAKVNGEDPSISTQKLPLVFGSIAGLLVFDTYNSQAAGILKEMVKEHVDGRTFQSSANIDEEKLMDREEYRAIKSTCDIFENIISSFDGVPNEQTLAVISIFFFYLGEASYIFMKGIILKLAGLMMLQERDATKTKHLQECIGSAVVAIGPQKMLTLIPVSVDPGKHICSNTWLVPILSMYVTGASLEYFLDHILPLVESLQQACHKVKKSSLRKDLQACIHGLWDLLSAFCRYPTDTHMCFERLAKVLTAFLKEDSYMHKNIALALQELVNQNRSILVPNESVSGAVNCSDILSTKDSSGKARGVPSGYSRDIATRNIQAMASCSVDLLQALTDVFFASPSDNRAYLKEAIGCLASITRSSKIKELFISSLEKFKVTNVDDGSEKLEGDGDISADEDFAGNAEKELEANRCLIMEFAYSLIAGAKEDLLDTIFNYIKPVLQASGAVGQSEAYFILSRIFKEHAWFCSSRFDEMVDLLLAAKSPGDVMTLSSRFSCFQNLLVSMLQSDVEDRNAKAFLILNEIILALKDSNEELRKAAYDVLLKISDSLNDSSLADSDSPHQQLLNMIMGYLSGAPPPIMSAAVAALSLLIYKNSAFCFSVPELVPSVLVLLQSKANEVIKAVLGFVKVLVSCLQTSDLQKFLPDIVDGIVPWSHVSKHHFRSKVATIFEIIIRKCGYGSVEVLVPDRYRSFLRTVKEQRHGKTSSKDAETSNNDPNLAVPFHKRENKRRHSFTSQDRGTDSRASSSSQMDRGSKRRKFDMPRTNEFRKSTSFGRGQSAPKSKSTHSHGSGSWIGGSKKPTKRKQANGRPFTGGKDNMRPVRDSKTSKSSFHKGGSSSKVRKRQKAV